MPNTRSRKQLIHVSGSIWLSPQLIQRKSDGSQFINVCVETETGELAAMEMLVLDSNGIYYKGDKAIGTIDSPEIIQYLKKYQSITDIIMSDERSQPQDEESLFEQTVRIYTEIKSIKKTAKLLKMSEEKARRILFTTGDYTCETHEKVMELLKKGMSLDEIAPIVGLSRHRIRAYLPY